MIWARTAVEGVQGTVTDFVFANALADFQADYGADLVGSTVIRVRGHVMATVDTTTPTFKKGVLAARVATQSTIPVLSDTHGPEQDRGADWFWYQPLALTAGAELSGAGGPVQRIEVDVRSARKLEEVGQTIIFGWQGSDEAGLITCTGYLSWLLKLP